MSYRTLEAGPHSQAPKALTLTDTQAGQSSRLSRRCPAPPMSCRSSTQTTPGLPSANVSVLGVVTLLSQNISHSTSTTADMDWTHFSPVSYTHLRAHETPEHLVCRLLL